MHPIRDVEAVIPHPLPRHPYQVVHPEPKERPGQQQVVAARLGADDGQVVVAAQLGEVPLTIQVVVGRTCRPSGRQAGAAAGAASGQKATQQHDTGIRNQTPNHQIKPIPNHK